jgi:hypothetical protein
MAMARAVKTTTTRATKKSKGNKGKGDKGDDRNFLDGGGRQGTQQSTRY